ncbi:MAG: hypothetical protein EAZ42_03570 [Verrucomicrobia bacterium]|nr:MAG: hypothetical protein EAZ42_03570 [Verrucomicrobiota bacterium]
MDNAQILGSLTLVKRNFSTLLKTCSAVLLTMPLISCGTLSQAGRDSAGAIAHGSQAAGKKLASLAQLSPFDAFRPAGVPVVEVREKDLKKMKTGEERALAYVKSRDRDAVRNSSWFSGPVSFEEVPLPDDLGAEADDILLPPKNF